MDMWILEYPFCITYLGKQEGKKDPVYIFLNKDMNKVHQEYKI